MHSTNSCILYASIALVIGLIIGYYTNKNKWLGNEYYGEIMDRMCMEGNCSTEEGIKTAVEQCKKQRAEVYGDKNNTHICEHPDPVIREMGCPEPCDVSSVASYILQKPDLGCSQPLQVKLIDVYDETKGKYIKQAYCMTQAGWDRYKEGDPKEKRKNEYFRYKY